MSRVTDLQLEFKDSRFQITGISEPKDDFSVAGGPPGLAAGATEGSTVPGQPPVLGQPEVPIAPPSL